MTKAIEVNPYQNEPPYDGLQLSPVTAELRFGYTNYRGETSERRVRPISIRYGKSEYHRADDWLLLAFDLDKNAEREFSMHDMVLVEPADALLLAPSTDGGGSNAA